LRLEFKFLPASSIQNDPKMATSEIFGKNLAILLWYVNEGFDPTAALIHGVLENQNGYLMLVRGAHLPSLHIPWKTAMAIQAVTPEVQDIFGDAGFWVEMTIRDLQVA
jgi:hypothetical protein